MQGRTCHSSRYNTVPTPSMLSLPPMTVSLCSSPVHFWQVVPMYRYIRPRLILNSLRARTSQ